MDREAQSKSVFATEPVGRLIVRFAIPCVISLVVNALYNIVDQIFVGWGVGYLGNGVTAVLFVARFLCRRGHRCSLSPAYIAHPPTALCSMALCWVPQATRATD